MGRGDGGGESAADERVGSLVDLLLAAGSLKNLPRTGWRLAGIRDCESVADHSYRVALIALLLGDLIAGLDRERLLRMAVLHDLPESVVTDLPTRAVELIGRATKQRAERDAWGKILPADQVLDEWRALWDEFEGGVTIEAKLVRMADKLEMLLQAYEYERAGFRNLDDFWNGTRLPDQGSELVRAILDELTRRRRLLSNGV